MESIIPCIGLKFIKVAPQNAGPANSIPEMFAGWK